MSAYEVETSKYDNVQEAIADSFVEGVRGTFHPVAFWKPLP